MSIISIDEFYKQMDAQSKRNDQNHAETRETVVTAARKASEVSRKHSDENHAGTRETVVAAVRKGADVVRKHSDSNHAETRNHSDDNHAETRRRSDSNHAETRRFVEDNATWLRDQLTVHHSPIFWVVDAVVAILVGFVAWFFTQSIAVIQQLDAAGNVIGTQANPYRMMIVVLLAIVAAVLFSLIPSKGEADRA